MSDLTFYKGTVEDPFTPFSNGTEGMFWESRNCERCSKAWYPKDGNWPKESTIREYVRNGKYCKLQYWLHIGWIEGCIPTEIAQQIGVDESKGGLKDCMLYSDNEDDGYKPPKRPKPDNTPDNQLTMPFYLQEIGITEVKQKEVLV